MIIPVWRGELAALCNLLPLLRDSPDVLETIISFAGAAPAEKEAALSFGAKCIEAGRPGRGHQLDLGAREATGEWLLFHHADTVLTGEHLRSLATLPSDGSIVGGAFYRKFDERHPWIRPFAFTERWHNRTFGALYGDQSIFARREAFIALHGFGDLPLMEDVDFSLRLRRHGPLALLNPAIASSPRKHLAEGPWRTTFSNALLLSLYHLGISPARLHSWYYRHDARCHVNSGTAAETPDASSLANPALLE